MAPTPSANKWEFRKDFQKELLEKYGPLPAHRKTFGPVRKVIEMRKSKEGELELS